MTNTASELRDLEMCFTGCHKHHTVFNLQSNPGERQDLISACILRDVHTSQPTTAVWGAWVLVLPWALQLVPLVLLSPVQT